MSFDVSNYLNPNAVDGDSIGLNLWEVSGLTRDGAVNKVFVGQAQNSTTTIPQSVSGNGTAVDTQIGGSKTIAGNELFTLDFMLNNAGTAGGYLCWVRQA